MADAMGVALTQGLWTAAPWSIQEDWTLGFLTLTGQQRPSYFAYQLCADHFGANAISVTGSPDLVHTYASRSAANDQTRLLIVNYNSETCTLSVDQSALGISAPTASVVVPQLSITAVELSDSGELHEWTYGSQEFTAQSGPRAVR